MTQVEMFPAINRDIAEQLAIIESDCTPVDALAAALRIASELRGPRGVGDPHLWNSAPTIAADAVAALEHAGRPYTGAVAS